MTSATSRILVHTAPKCGIESIRCVSLHFRDRHGAASLRCRYRAEITVRTSKQKPYPVWFSFRPEAIRHGFRVCPKLSAMVFVSARSYPVRFSCLPEAIRYSVNIALAKQRASPTLLFVSPPAQTHDS